MQINLKFQKDFVQFNAALIADAQWTKTIIADKTRFRKNVVDLLSIYYRDLLSSNKNKNLPVVQNVI